MFGRSEDKIHEECAVAGVCINADESAGIIYNALLALQHRGQEGAGIAVLRESRIINYKKRGLVSEVFDGETLKNLPKGRIAIGHTRYSTTGSNTLDNVQPFVTEYLTGRIATAHNGNIVNAKEIKERLRSMGVDFVATSDSEVVSALIAYHVVKSKGDELRGVKEAVRQLQGAFSLIIMTSKNRLILIRDGYGFRPLCIGRNVYGMMGASESVALDCCGFKFVRDVAPGEMVVIENGEIASTEKIIEKDKSGLCIFEYVYFARPDSVIDGQSVYKARFNMGVRLSEEFSVDADCVAGVPDSGLDCAAGYAFGSGLPLVSAFVKNRYVGRSFIYPSQLERESAVRVKLNPLKFNINNKKIVLIDDSIVRGTTTAKTVKALKDAGAKEVHMRISSPPFKHTCYFGTDIDKVENLIANKLGVDEIRKKIGADSLAYISVDGMRSACSDCALGFCAGCFSGKYNIDINEYDKDILEKKEGCISVEKK
ncbi:MAG: amidophosphoribosyltransferase [Clostridiales bacterium]|jgi:amidophosphoribosyltransferase|nr:amidophosphoribosyltransferase [Clostridiales bacterium]